MLWYGRCESIVALRNFEHQPNLSRVEGDTFLPGIESDWTRTSKLNFKFFKTDHVRAILLLRTEKTEPCATNRPAIGIAHRHTQWQPLQSTPINCQTAHNSCIQFLVTAISLPIIYSIAVDCTLCQYQGSVGLPPAEIWTCWTASTIMYGQNR